MVEALVREKLDWGKQAVKLVMPLLFFRRRMERGGRKIKKVRQLQKYDCGAACLSSVAQWYGLYLPLLKIRYLCGCSEEGISIKGILDGAEKMGFLAKAYKSPEKEMSFYKEINTPVIAHIKTEENMLHFVTIYGIDGGKVKIMDPAEGEVKRVEISRFKECWSGIVVILTPGAGFMRSGTKISGVSRYYSLLLPHKGKIALLLALSIVIMAIGIFYSVLLQHIIDNAILATRRDILTSSAIILVIITLLSIALNYLRDILGVKTGLAIDRKLVGAYIKKLFRLPIRFFRQYRAGDLNSRVADSFKVREVICEGLVAMVVNFLALLCCIAIMFLYNSKIALMVTLYIPLYLLLFFVSKRINKKYNRQLALKGAEMESDIISNIGSIESLKYYNSEELAIKGIKSDYSGLLQLLHRAGRAVVGFDTMASSLSRTLTAAILILGGFYSLAGNVTAGELVSFYTLCAFFTSPLNNLITMNNLLAEADVSLERLYEILDTEDELQERIKGKHLPQDSNVNISHLSYSFPGADALFKDLNLTIERGRLTIITGESGSGKSTLLSLMAADYPLQEGEITIGGIRVCDIRIDLLREYITIVPQKSTLFTASLLENIVCNREEYDLERVKEIITRLRLNELVNSLPLGLYTQIKEDRVKLSGGEIQRIAIARALYRESELYLFDEPLAGVDIENKKIIIEEIFKLVQRGKCVVVVTHELALFKEQEIIECALKGGSLHTKFAGIIKNYQL